MALLGVERDGHRARAGGGGEVRVDRERRPRVDELGAGLEQSLAGGEQDVAGAVADRDPRRGHAVAVGQAGAEDRVGRVGVAVERGERAFDRLAHLRQRRVGRLVAGKAHEGLLLGVAARGRIDGDARDPLCELEGHLEPIVPSPGLGCRQRSNIVGRASPKRVETSPGGVCRGITVPPADPRAKRSRRRGTRGGTRGRSRRSNGSAP